jgi:hypothetical protein
MDPGLYNNHPCSAIAIEIYSKQCEFVLSAIKGNRWETIVVHDCQHMQMTVHNIFGPIVKIKNNEQAVFYLLFYTQYPN